MTKISSTGGRGLPSQPNTPSTFIEVTRIVERNFWSDDRLNPQAMLKGAVEGITPELRNQGGDVRYQNDHIALSLGDHTRAIPSSFVQTIPEVIQAFTDIHGFLLQHQRANAKATPWEYHAIERMIKALNKNSRFMPPDVFREMQEKTKDWSFGGIGIHFGFENREMVILEVMEGTPASSAGLQERDRIIKIDGHPTKGLTFSEAFNRMDGTIGSRIVLSIWRAGFAEPEEFSLIRAKIALKTLESRLLDGRIGHVKVRGFNQSTFQETEKALAHLAQEKVEGLIFDLRNNPGGLLTQAIEVCKLFVEEGRLVVSTKGRARNQNMRFVASGGGQYRHYPLTVLINSGSTAGAEIVAGALQDLQQATLIGTKSNGQGSIQTIFPLHDGSGLRLTTAYWFTPSGRNIDGIGITPDIEIRNASKEDRQLIMAHAIMKEVLTITYRGESPDARGTAPVSTSVIKEVARRMGLL